MGPPGGLRSCCSHTGWSKLTQTPPDTGPFLGEPDHTRVRFFAGCHWGKVISQQSNILRGLSQVIRLPPKIHC